MTLVNLLLFFGYVLLYLLSKEAYNNIKDYGYKPNKIFDHIISCVKCNTFWFSLPLTLTLYPLFVAIGLSALLSLAAEIMDIYIQNKF